MQWAGALSALGVVAVGVAPAGAGELDPSFAARAGLVAAAFEPAFAQAEPWTMRLDVDAGVGYLFENGVEIGFAGSVGVERDHPGADPRALAPLDTGAPPPTRDPGPRAGLEAGYVYVRGPWGEASLGRDEGAAGRFSLSPPSVFRYARASAAALDPAGAGLPVLANDLSGASLKVAALSPRWLGLRLGAAYTPELEADGLDVGDGGAGAPERIVEGGVSFARSFAGGTSLALAATGLSAESGASDGDRAVVWGGGARVRRGDWTIGAALLHSDNDASAGGRYRSVGAGLTREAGAWTLGLEAAWGEESFDGVEVTSFGAGVARGLAEGVELAFGLRRAARLVGAEDEAAAIGAVVELRLAR